MAGVNSNGTRKPAAPKFGQFTMDDKSETLTLSRLLCFTTIPRKKNKTRIQETGWIVIF